MRKTANFLIALFFGLAVFGIVMWLVGLETVLEAFFFFLSPKGLIIFLLTFASMTASVLKWKFVLRKITGLKEFKGLAKIWYAGFAVTYLFTPFAALGGEPFRAYAIKKLYNLDWRKSAASVIIERVLDWTIFLILTVIGVFFLVSLSGFSSGAIIVSAAILLFFLSCLFVFFYSKALKKESVIEWFLELFGIKKKKFSDSENGAAIFETEKEIISFLSPRKKIFWQGLSLAFLKQFFCFLRVGVMVFFLTGGKSIIQTMAVFGFTNLALIFPTPAAIGSLEATGALAFKFLSLNPGFGPIFAMVIRGADILMSLIGAVFLVKFTFNFTGQKVLRFFDNIFKEEKEE